MTTMTYVRRGRLHTYELSEGGYVQHTAVGLSETDAFVRAVLWWANPKPQMEDMVGGVL